MEPPPQQLLKLLLLRLLRQPFKTKHTTHKKNAARIYCPDNTMKSFLLDYPKSTIFIPKARTSLRYTTFMIYGSMCSQSNGQIPSVRSSNSNKNNSYESALVSCVSLLTQKLRKKSGISFNSIRRSTEEASGASETQFRISFLLGRLHLQQKRIGSLGLGLRVRSEAAA